MKVFSRSAGFTDPTVLYIDEMQIVAHERYTADVVSFSDYFPYGWEMPGRNGGAAEYRYGFNAQEKDDEITGSGNSYTAEFWQYDARLGRRWNRDPKPNPAISDYACFAGNPILYSDPLGDTIKVDGGLIFNIRIIAKIQMMRVLGQKEIREKIKTLRNHSSLIVIIDETPKGKSSSAQRRSGNTTISLHKKARWHRFQMSPGKGDMGKWIHENEKANLANELSHAFNNAVGEKKKGDIITTWAKKPEKVSNEEMESNEVENMVRGLLRPERRVESHYSAFFKNSRDARRFKRIMRLMQSNSDKASKITKKSSSEVKEYVKAAKDKIY